MKRLFLIHGWSGGPNKNWFPWVRSKLEKDYEVFSPLMPNADEPEIESWISTLEKLVGHPGKEDVFIGHSIGCQAILRFLEKVPVDEKIDKVLMVAPWVKLVSLEDEESWKIARPWIETPIDFTKVKSKANSFVAIFSYNDPFVPLEENEKIFGEKLGSRNILLKNKRHFGQKKLLEILSFLL